MWWVISAHAQTGHDIPLPERCMATDSWRLSAFKNLKVREMVLAEKWRLSDYR